jgi:hypothetical protein
MHVDARFPARMKLGIFCRMTKLWRMGYLVTYGIVKFRTGWRGL